MDVEKSPFPASEPVAKAPQSSEQMTPTPAASKKTGAKVPEGYKLVKIAKPDGTHKIVLRPIKKPATTGAASTSTPPAKDAVQPAKPVIGASSTVKTPTKDTEQAPKAITTNSSGTTPAATTPKKPATAGEKVVAPPAHTSKLDAVSKSARIYGKLYRFHRNAAILASAFDPDFGDLDDYEDGGADEDGDIDLADDDDDNDSGSESDDSDREDDSQQNNHSSSGNRTTGNVTRAVAANVGHVPPRTTANATATSKKPEVTVEEKRGSQTSNEFSKETSVQEKELLPLKALVAEAAGVRPPRPLPKRYTDWGRLIAWTLVIVFPLAFIGLGIAIATLHGQPVTKVKTIKYWDPDYEVEYDSEYSSRVERGFAITHVTKAAVTAWPIVFAAILGQTLKAVATYRVERGIRLGTLEQLISSHSVAGALKQPFILRQLNWITFALFALWSLSPLGSQAMQYTVTQYDDMDTNKSISISYLNTFQENPSLSTAYQAVNNYSNSMDVLFAAVFSTPSQFQPKPSDPWGNPLIPIIETNTSTPIKVNLNDDYPYASYYGIPLDDSIGNKDGGYGGVWNYSMKSSYLLLECDLLQFMIWDEIADLLLHEYNEDLNDFPSTTGNSLWMNMTAPKSIAQPGNLTFVSGCSQNKTDDGKLRYAFTTCSLQQTFVQSKVTCEDTDCAVVEIAKLVTWQPTEMQNFMPEFIKASDTGLSFYPYIGDTSYSITELFLADAYNATAPGAGDTCNLNYPDITDRLGYLVNTYYSTGFANDYSLGAIPAGKTVSVYNVTTGKEVKIPLTTPTTALHQYQDLITPTLYRVHWQWLITYVVCAALLMLIGIFGILLESRTIAPDILGFASSVARHSRYVKLPKVDGTMSGGERARRTRDCVVMMQDVRPDDPVGKIVLGTATPGAVRLTPTRSYK
ncbi:hypothetical protein V8E51_015846 [Hyaloscypha variabilis]